MDEIEEKEPETTEYHHFIGVRYDNSLERDDPIHLRYGPITVTTKDIKNLKLANEFMQNKLLNNDEETQKQIEAIFGVEFITEYEMMKMSARFNSCTIHHFVTKFPMTDEDWVIFVKAANYDPHTRKQLQESKI